MFCPACKAEYRAGFTQCADCKVALVSELPKRTSPEAYVLLWRGEDPVFHDTLRGELANVGIEYADTPLEVYFRNSENLFNFKLGPRFGFVISVKTGYFAAARAIRERLLDREPADVALPESQREESGTPIDSSSFPLHWDPLTASVEIWTGRNLDRLHFLANSLREVGIPSRSLMEQRDLCLLVRAEDEPRARDIVRQVSEAVVPEESVLRPVADIWHDEPVRSYLFAWLPAVIFLGLGILAYTVVSNAGQIFTLDPLFSVLGFVDKIGTVWMIYQAVRYEIRPWRFILLSFLPISWIWYYFERYSRRQGRQRLPIAVRERISPRPSA